MSEKKVIPAKYFYYGMLGCVLFIGAVFFFVWQRESKNNKLLDEKGVKATAWVLNLYERKTSKRANPRYYVEVAFFADSTKAIPNTVVKDTLKKPLSKSDELIAAIAQQTASLHTPLGDYETQTIELSSYEIYKTYQINDKLKIEFLPEDHKVIRLVHK